MSLGNKIGRGLGVVGALAVEGAVRGATGLGQFGADVIDGAETGYAEKHAALLVSRAEADARKAAAIAARKAAHVAALNPQPMVAAPQPAKRAVKA